ncbi:MAG: hypothetical protein ACK56F_03825, partial [bacterium]
MHTHDWPGRNLGGYTPNRFIALRDQYPSACRRIPHQRIHRRSTRGIQAHFIEMQKVTSPIRFCIEWNGHPLDGEFPIHLRT